MVAAIDRLGRRYLETMWAIYDLQRRGIRLRSLADSEVQWTKYLDADPDSPEAFMGNVLASMAAYVASQERQNISRQHQGGPRRRQGEGRGAGPAPAVHQRAAHRHPAGRGGRDAGGGGGTEVRGAQVHPPQRPGSDGMRLVKCVAIFKNTCTFSELGVVPDDPDFRHSSPVLSVTQCNDMRKTAACWTCGRTFWVWRLRERNFCSGKCRVRHHRSALRRPRNSSPGQNARRRGVGQSPTSELVSMSRSAPGSIFRSPLERAWYRVCLPVSM